MIGLPYSFENLADQTYCGRPSAASRGRYVWVECMDGGHLIDLATFQSQAYPAIGMPLGWSAFATPDVEWSSDGKFARISGDGDERILSVESKELKTSPAGSNVVWHPTSNTLAYLSNEGRTLSLLDAGTMATQEAALPGVFQGISWSPTGELIALLAEDGSVWQIDYPGLKYLEQLTPPSAPGSVPAPSNIRRPQTNHLVWLPDGSALAVTGGVDVYIADAGGNP